MNVLKRFWSVCSDGATICNVHTILLACYDSYVRKTVIQQQHRECTRLDLSDVQTLPQTWPQYINSPHHLTHIRFLKFCICTIFISLFDLFSIKIDTVVYLLTQLATHYVWPSQSINWNPHFLFFFSSTYPTKIHVSIFCNFSCMFLNSNNLFQFES